MEDHRKEILNYLAKFKNSTKTRYELNGHGVTIADVTNIARSNFSEHKIVVNISGETKKKLEENAAYLKECLLKKEVIYGVNTGYGGSANVRSEDCDELNNVLLTFLNCGARSKCLDVGVVRASMFSRANSLSRAYSGVRPEVVEQLCSMINQDIVPQVPLRGSVSASGDLVPLSYIASCMSGAKKDSKVYFKGKLNSTAELAFKEAGLRFIEFQPKEVLAIINSSTCSAAFGAVNLFDFSQGLLLTELVTAMSLECLRGRMESFHPTVDQCLPHWGLKQFSESIRFLLQESKFVRHKNALNETELAQDRYALRTSPQWIGPCIEVFKESVRKIHVELNSTNDNPIIDSVEKNIVHCGNFQGSNIVLVMDQTRQSIQMCGRLIFAQLTEVLNYHMNSGLPPNLSGSDHTKDFGFKGVDIALASYASELDSLAHPMTNHVMSAEMHNQSVNSMALVSARKTCEALELLQLIISSSILSLCQAIDLRWLQKEITFVWQRVTEEVLSANILINSQEWSWYDAAFRFDDVVAKLKRTIKQLPNNGFFTNGTLKHFVSRLKDEFGKVLSRLNQCLQIDEVSQDMGFGTRKLYRYIRCDLKIEFHDGVRQLDDSLEKILKSLQDRTIVDVIIDIFMNQSDLGLQG